jgi:hypothetical protein
MPGKELAVIGDSDFWRIPKDLETARTIPPSPHNSQLPTLSYPPVEQKTVP